MANTISRETGENKKFPFGFCLVRRRDKSDVNLALLLLMEVCVIEEPERKYLKMYYLPTLGNARTCSKLFNSHIDLPVKIPMQYSTKIDNFSSIAYDGWDVMYSSTWAHYYLLWFGSNSSSTYQRHWREQFELSNQKSTPLYLMLDPSSYGHALQLTISKAYGDVTPFGCPAEFNRCEDGEPPQGSSIGRNTLFTRWQ
uniref:Uncharacterized protein n=1 Tax=Romanomermis culicivorax TaxID=13658 RepID=A0A915IE60_ROMCU